MIWLIIGIALLCALLASLHIIAHAEPKTLLRTGRWLFAFLMLGMVAVLVLSGKIQFIWLAFLSLLPWARRFLTVWGLWRLWGGAKFTGGTRQDRSSDSHAADGQRRMSRTEALEVLGLPPDASERDIRAAYHRLMKQAHPDHGGSDWLAMRLNEAKDVLLEK